MARKPKRRSSSAHHGRKRRPGGPPLTPQARLDLALLIERTKGRATKTAIAKSTGHDRRTIEHVAAEYELPLRDPGRRRGALTDAQRAAALKVIRAAKAKRTACQLKAETGHDPKTITHLATEAHVDLLPATKPGRLTPERERKAVERIEGLTARRGPQKISVLARAAKLCWTATYHLVKRRSLPHKPPSRKADLPATPVGPYDSPVTARQLARDAELPNKTVLRWFAGAPCPMLGRRMKIVPRSKPRRVTADDANSLCDRLCELRKTDCDLWRTVAEVAADAKMKDSSVRRRIGPVADGGLQCKAVRRRTAQRLRTIDDCQQIVTLVHPRLDEAIVACRQDVDTIPAGWISLRAAINRFPPLTWRIGMAMLTVAYYRQPQDSGVVVHRRPYVAEAEARELHRRLKAEPSGRDASEARNLERYPESVKRKGSTGFRPDLVAAAAATTIAGVRLLAWHGKIETVHTGWGKSKPPCYYTLPKPDESPPEPAEENRGKVANNAPPATAGHATPNGPDRPHSRDDAEAEPSKADRLDKTWWTYPQLAGHFGCTVKSARGKVHRFRDKHPDRAGTDFQVNPDRRARQAGELYLFGAVKHLFS